MRILFFTDGLIAGGKERMLVELIKGIKSNPDIELDLIVMNREIHYKEVFDFDIKIHYLLRKTKRDVSVFYKFYKICKKYKPEIVHCCDSMTAIYSIPACKLLRIKFVNGLVRDAPPKQVFLNKYVIRARFSFLFSNIIIGNSKAGLMSYKAPLKRSICIYNGMDLTRFDNLKDPLSVRKEIFGNDHGDFFVAGMVAAFEDRKDYKTLIKTAISAVSIKENMRFVLVGNGTNFDEMKNSVPHLLFKKIIFLGRRSDVESIINIFDVGILLTNTDVHGEGISNSIIEYMALGKPVIATRGGGTNEVVFDSQNGFLIDTYNGDQLMEKIEMLIKNHELKENLGREGYRMVHEKFDLKIMADQHMSVYNSLLNRK